MYITKEARNFCFSLLYPLRGSTALLAVGSRVLDIDIPPKSPFDKGGLCQASRPRAYKQKIRWKTIGPFVVPPQGVAYTRTEGRKTNNPWTWFAIGFDFLSK